MPDLFFIDSAREYLIATVVLIVFGFLALALLCLGAIRAYKRTTNPGYPAHKPSQVPRRREPHIDLAAAREEHERLKEEHQEEVLLRRAV